MARPALEVADTFRGHGAAWRHANRGHVTLDQLKVMSAIESCRTAAPRRPCGTLRGLRPYNDRLQQLPQSALPQMPGRGRARMDGGARGRAAPGALFPCR